MAFIIDDQYVQFTDYTRLESYSDKLPLITKIIKLTKAWFDPSQRYFEFKTSGSTGTPKTISHSRSSIEGSARITQSFFGYAEGDLTLLSLPPDYVAGRMLLYRSFVSGLDIIIDDISGRPLKNIEKELAFLAMTPLQLANTLANDRDRLVNVRCLLLGGAAINKSIEESVSNLAIPVYIGYGMTETLTHVALRRLNGPLAAEIYNSVADNIEFSLSSESCLIIRADHLDSTVITNDIVELMDSRSFIWYGRRDNVVNSGGIKIQLEPLEEILSNALGINLMLFGADDKLLGEKLSLIIERNDFQVFENHIFSALDLIDKLKRPKQVFVVERLINTASNKLDRKATISTVDFDKAIQL